jgi:hypothetical protein
MARTTLDLDPTVLRELRKRGHAEGKSMGQVASEVLAQALVDPGRGERQPFTWVARDLGHPLVDLEDADALWAVLDARG